MGPMHTVNTCSAPTSFAVLDETTRELRQGFARFEDAARTNRVVVGLDAAGQVYELRDIPGRMGEELGERLEVTIPEAAPARRHLRLV